MTFDVLSSPGWHLGVLKHFSFSPCQNLMGILWFLGIPDKADLTNNLFGARDAGPVFFPQVSVEILRSFASQKLPACEGVQVPEAQQAEAAAQ